MAVSVQYGVGMRNQEMWVLTIGDVAGRRATVREVLSYRALDTGKTEGCHRPGPSAADRRGPGGGSRGLEGSARRAGTPVRF
jgi:hypothetical protein